MRGWTTAIVLCWLLPSVGLAQVMPVFIGQDAKHCCELKLPEEASEKRRSDCFREQHESSKLFKEIRKSVDRDFSYNDPRRRAFRIALSICRQESFCKHPNDWHDANCDHTKDWARAIECLRRQVELLEKSKP